ncbi:ATP-dependent DNA ligase [Candidatus Bathyarchaeota archaeon]|nr:MAG: ATP-dependent DNA ligase [Candidatus Bathyarchaeota archaeon]
MLFSKLVGFYERIEAITGRIEMTNLLVQLLKETPPEIIDKVVYLTLGEIYPPFIGLELGVADRLALRAVKLASGMSEREIDRAYKELGDVGLVGERMLAKRSQATLFMEQLTVEDVYSALEKIAKASGEGSMETKVQILSGLLASAQPKEAKYILRIVTGKMRLGIADMTILDALAIVFGGGKEARDLFERAYNLSSDIGYVAKVAAQEGLEGIKKFKITVGKPIRPMLAERLSSAEEILQKIGGKCIAEYKYDGERMQIHKKGDEVLIFSRRLENITSQYPDVVELVKQHVKAGEAILECECVAVDPETGDMLPFQELMHRKRKHDIHKAIEQYPVNVYFFEALYVDGKDLTLEPLEIRRKTLESIIEEGERVKLSKAIITDDPNEIEKFFHEAIEEGCEGLVVKALGKEAIYRAGARGWLWIKLKRSYKSEMMDTVDLVVVGAFHGRGKRSGTYGALLMAAYDKRKDVFQSVCKVGSGFTDEDLQKLPELLEPYKIPHRHARVETGMEADIWFEPKIVLEIIGDEITISPIHRAAWSMIKEGYGLAIRFPRFTGRYRFDKAPEDATTTDEILEMYRRQLKKLTPTPPGGQEVT